MGLHLLPFLVVAVLLIITPGPDTALVTKNVVLYGRRSGLVTTLGISGGLMVWTVASAVGVAAIVRASAVAFTALKLLGAAYLLWLGVQALRAARAQQREPGDAGGSSAFGAGGIGVGAGARRLDDRLSFRQGVFGNLANPKIGLFFTSLLPQFTVHSHAVLPALLLLGGLFVLLTVAWLSSYAVVAARIADTLRRPRVRAMLERVTGVVMIGLAIRIATERR